MFTSWDLKSKITRNIQMHAAGRGMFMKVFVTNPVDIKIGSETFQWSVYIAPIDDDMLVGLDFFF